MATGKRYYYIKLKKSFMESDEIDFLMSQPNGADYVVLYLMLCFNTINSGGRMATEIGELIIPYDAEKIQRETKWFSIDTINIALTLYSKLGLIYENNDGTLTIARHNEMVGVETSWKEQKANQRQKKLPRLANCQRLNASTLRLPCGDIQYVDEKRYGGNGMLAFDNAGGRCEMCGSEESLCIHHANGYSNDPNDLYILCTKCHGIAHSSSTPKDWLHHNWEPDLYGGQVGGQEGGQEGGQGGGHVHPEIRDIEFRDIEFRDKSNTSGNYNTCNNQNNTPVKDNTGNNQNSTPLKDKTDNNQKIQGNQEYCAELPASGHSTQKAKPTPSEFDIPLQDGTTYNVPQENIEVYKRLYPGVDVEQQLRNMIGWSMAAGTRRKTRRGIKRFITNWLIREQDSGRKGGANHGANRGDTGGRPQPVCDWDEII